MFEKFTLLHVPREKNERADLLAKLESTQKGGLNRIVIQEALGQPTSLTNYTKEVHKRVCGSHIGGRALASIITCTGFYWPTLKRDNLVFVKKCDKCQRCADRHQTPLEQLHYVISPWPFYIWGGGVDILDPFPLVPRQVKFLLVAVDYFTKWIEFYVQYGIKQAFTSVEHPQSNGQAKAVSRVILRGLRKWLEEAKGHWVEELPQVLWYIIPHHTRSLKKPFSV
ncbi:hypothetical protein CR513_51036, partial [Mucuna pruriens]